MAKPQPPNDHEQKEKRENLKQEVWARSLARFPTTFGRLAYLASLRDEHSGLYWEAVFAGGGYEREQVDLLLREIHEEVFGTWLSFSLADQRDELQLYLQSLSQGARTQLDPWLTLDPYWKLIPESAELAERALYRSDLEMLLELLGKEFV